MVSGEAVWGQIWGSLCSGKSQGPARDLNITGGSHGPCPRSWSPAAAAQPPSAWPPGLCTPLRAPRYLQALGRASLSGFDTCSPGCRTHPSGTGRGGGHGTARDSRTASAVPAGGRASGRRARRLVAAQGNLDTHTPRTPQTLPGMGEPTDLGLGPFLDPGVTPPAHGPPPAPTPWRWGQAVGNLCARLDHALGTWGPRSLHTHLAPPAESVWPLSDPAAT